MENIIKGTEKNVKELIANGKTTILAGVQSGKFTNLLLSEDTTAARLLAVKNAALLLVPNPNVTITVTYISPGNYNITLGYVGSNIQVTFPLTATFVFTQALQDKVDIEKAQKTITDYYTTYNLIVKDYNSNVKYDAFIAKTNYLLANQNVTMTVKSVIHRPGYNPSTFEITITKNTTKVTFIVNVTYAIKVN